MVQRRRAARRPSAQAHARARRATAGKAPRAPRAPRAPSAKGAKGARRYHYEGLMVDYFTKAIGGPVGPRKMVVHLDVPIIDARTGRLRHRQEIEWDLYLPPTPSRPGVVLECQGIGHYRPVEAWGGVRGFIGQLRRDEVKRREARRRGYYYIEISNTHAADPMRVCGEPEFMRRMGNALRGWRVHLDFWRLARAEALARMTSSPAKPTDQENKSYIPSAPKPGAPDDDTEPSESVDESVDESAGESADGSDGPRGNGFAIDESVDESDGALEVWPLLGASRAAPIVVD